MSKIDSNSPRKPPIEPHQDECLQLKCSQCGGPLEGRQRLRVCDRCGSRKGKWVEAWMAVKAGADSDEMDETFPRWHEIRHYATELFGDFPSETKLVQRVSDWLAAEHEISDIGGVERDQVLGLLKKELQRRRCKPPPNVGQTEGASPGGDMDPVPAKQTTVKADDAQGKTGKGKGGKPRRRRGRPSSTKREALKLYQDWKAAHQKTGISKPEFLQERGLPETDLATLERGRTADYRRRKPKSE